jgi:hypothetical protein
MHWSFDFAPLMAVNRKKKKIKKKTKKKKKVKKKNNKTVKPQIAL